MKRDIDGLMQERGIDVAVVTGAVKGNATMYYMVNGASISHAIVIMKRNDAPVLLCPTDNGSSRLDRHWCRSRFALPCKCGCARHVRIAAPVRETSPLFAPAAAFRQRQDQTARPRALLPPANACCRRQR